MSASLEAIKSQPSQEDSQPEESILPSSSASRSSLPAKRSRRMDIHGHDEELTVKSRVEEAHTRIGSEYPLEADALGRNTQSTSSSTEYVAQLPLSNYSDVIDRGLITMDTAKRAFQHFVVHMMPEFPIVVIESTDDVEQMRQEKPTLFLSILNAASGKLLIHIQREINRELHRLFADRALVVGEKSLELIQALQIAMIWYYPPERYEELKFYALIHVTCVMAIDIGLNRRGKALKVMGFIDFSRGRSLQRKQHPDSSLIECRRAWLGCYFLAAVTAQNMRRANLIRWTSYLEECLQLLETSAGALPSDQVLCHWIRAQRIADEVGEQFNIEDPTRLSGLDDIRIKSMVQGFEAQLRECYSRMVYVPKSPSIIFGETHIRLYLHEVALNAGKNNEVLWPPFTQEDLKILRPSRREELSAGHIDSLSISLTSIHTIYQTFLSIPPATLRCLPTFHFVRLIYLSVVFIKLTADGDDFDVGRYLDDIISHMKVAAQDNQCVIANQFSMVLVLLRTLIVKRKPHGIANGVAASTTQPLESGQVGQTLQESSTSSQPSAANQGQRSVKESEIPKGPPLYTNPVSFGMETASVVRREVDGDNISSLGAAPEISTGYIGSLEIPDFDMADEESFHSFFMDDDFINSILANAPLDFFTQTGMEYTS
ncbi:hypothetical protein MMC11_006717 [Xylographa trunciseda]|nr:hypothetical protein [Xylographa trunciseda]